MLKTIVIIIALPFTARAEETAAEFAARLKRGIERGASALCALQGADGGWHSGLYGHLKPGAALTALTLETLSRLPADERAKHEPAIRKGMAFLVASQGSDNALGTKSEWLEFPVYANALTVIAFSRLQPENWKTTIEPWLGYIKKAQHSEDNGCAAGDAAYGGWGPLGIPSNGRRRQSDLSTTRCALQALAAAGVAPEDKCWTRARAFLARVQNLPEGRDDGGFFFSTTHPELNKAGTAKADSKQFRSYGTCTADGLLSLSLFPAKDVKVSFDAASKWFAAYGNARVCAGFEGTDLEAQGWRDGLNYYYRAAVADAATRVAPQAGKFDQDWWRDLARATLAGQRTDGAWASETTAMKENDPLISTPLALEALLICNAQLSVKTEPLKP
jgi:hypothetical protein